MKVENKEHQALLGYLKRTHRKIKFLRGATALGHLLMVASICTLVAFGLDYFLHLQSRYRFWLAIALSGVVLFFLLLFMVICLRPFREEEVSLLYEGENPQLQDSLISSIQLAQKPSPYVSQALIQATIHQAKTSSKGLSQTQVLPFGSFVVTNFLVLLMGAGLAMAYVQQPKLAGIFFDRFVKGEDTPWPRKVELEIAGIPKFVPEGDSFTLNAEVTKGRPDEVICLLFQKGDGEPQEIRLDRKDKLKFEKTFSPQENMKLQVVAGDYESDIYEVVVRTRPTMRIQYKRQYPKYLNLEDDQSWYSWSNIEIWWGTEVEFRGYTSKPITEAYLLLEGRLYGGLDVKKEPENNRSVIRGRFISTGGSLIPRGLALIESRKKVEKKKKTKQTRWEPTEYAFSFVLKDRELKNTTEKFTIQVKPDQLPRVKILSPNFSQEITGRGKFDMNIALSDDFGLKEAKLVVEVYSPATHSKLIKGEKVNADHVVVQNLPLPEGGVKEHNLTLPFKASSVLSDKLTKLQVGSLLQVYAQARDFKDFGTANISESAEKIEINIVDAAKIRSHFKRIIDDIEIKLKNVLEDQGQVKHLLQKVALSEKFIEGKASVEDSENLSSARSLQNSVTRGLKSSREKLLQALALLQQNQLHLSEDRNTTLVNIGNTLEKLASEDSPLISKKVTTLLAESKREVLESARDLQSKVSSEVIEILSGLNEGGGFEEIIQGFQDAKQSQRTILKRTLGTIRKSKLGQDEDR